MIDTCAVALERFRREVSTHTVYDVTPNSSNEVGDTATFLHHFDEALSEVRYSLFTANEIGRMLTCENELSTIWEDFTSLSDRELLELRSRVDLELASLLLTYAGRNAILAVRDHDKQRLRDAAMALTVDADRLDYRDILVTATLVYDAATRIGEDPEMIFRQTLTYATPDRKRLISEWLRAPEFTKSIQSKGFDAIGVGERFTYVLRL